MSKKVKKLKEERKELRSLSTLDNEVLQYLKNNATRSWNHKQVASASGLVGKVAHQTVEKSLRRLVEAGKAVEAERGKFQIEQKLAQVTGRIEIMRDGFGFVRPDEGEQDIFIAAKNIGKAFHGDTVSVRLIRHSKGSNLPEGEITGIVERNRIEFVGTIHVWDKMAYVTPDDPRVTHDFLIASDKTMGARTDDKVLIKLLRWDKKSPEAEVVQVLGKAGEHETEMHAIILQYGFRTEFPAEVESEAEAIPSIIPASEIKKRRDFREITTFTIDPIDAKDFDDALSFRKLPNGNYEIGVHIADVSYYVQEGTILDKEAFFRATSVYLVDRTIPMLPEALSNQICSLKPNEDRLTFSSVFEFTPAGERVGEWFGRTIIHSDRRFNYEEAQDILDKGEGDFVEELNILDKISKVLREERFRQGSISFEDDEVKFELDAAGKPVRIFRKIRKDTHKLIEDFMLLANRRVAEFVNKKRKNPELPFVYRIHDWPDSEKLRTLRDFVKNLGYDLDLSSDRSVVKSLNKLISDVDGKPEQHIIQSVAVRTMAKAIYSTKNIGHYGLAFEFYSHFTSPIRRYPDMMVHRLLAKYLDNKFDGDFAKLEIQCRHSSDMEKKAAEAERASIKYKQVEYLEDKIGQEFDGIISGVTNWGLFVELVDSKSDGMIALSELKDDYYEVDQEHYCVRGRRSGRVIHLGDLVKVEVKSADVQQRLIDFKLIEVLEHRLSGVGTYGSSINTSQVAKGEFPDSPEYKGIDAILRLAKGKGHKKGGGGKSKGEGNKMKNKRDGKRPSGESGKGRSGKKRR